MSAWVTACHGGILMLHIHQWSPLRAKDSLAGNQATIRVNAIDLRFKSIDKPDGEPKNFAVEKTKKIVHTSMMGTA
jgi:hypothetical protein